MRGEPAARSRDRQRCTFGVGTKRSIIEEEMSRSRELPGPHDYIDAFYHGVYRDGSIHVSGGAFSPSRDMSSTTLSWSRQAPSASSASQARAERASGGMLGRSSKIQCKWYNVDLQSARINSAMKAQTTNPRASLSPSLLWSEKQRSWTKQGSKTLVHRRLDRHSWIETDPRFFLPREFRRSEVPNVTLRSSTSLGFRERREEEEEEEEDGGQESFKISMRRGSYQQENLQDSLRYQTDSIPSWKEEEEEEGQGTSRPEGADSLGETRRLTREELSTLQLDDGVRLPPKENFDLRSWVVHLKRLRGKVLEGRDPFEEIARPESSSGEWIPRMRQRHVHPSSSLRLSMIRHYRSQDQAADPGRSSNETSADRSRSLPRLPLALRSKQLSRPPSTSTHSDDLEHAIDEVLSLVTPKEARMYQKLAPLRKAALVLSEEVAYNIFKRHDREGNGEISESALVESMKEMIDESRQSQADLDVSFLLLLFRKERLMQGETANFDQLLSYIINTTS